MVELKVAKCVVVIRLESVDICLTKVGIIVLVWSLFGLQKRLKVEVLGSEKESEGKRKRMSRRDCNCGDEAMNRQNLLQVLMSLLLIDSLLII